MPTEVLRTDTFETWRQKSNTISADIGTTSALDSNLVNKTITLTETGNYVTGQVVTGSLSGVTATVVSINGTILTVKNVSAGTFIDRSVQKSYMSVVNGSGSYTPGATITGSISGATAKVFSFNSVDSTLVIYNITGAFQSSPPENIVQGGTTRQLIGVILNNSSDSGENIVQASPSVSKQLKSFNHDVVSSLNEHQSDIGDVDSLGTTSKNLVGAVNEVKNSTITFNGNKTFSGNTSLQGVLGVQGATSLQGVLGVQGATSLSTVSTSGLATLHSALVSNSLTVQGTTSLQTVNYSSGTVSGNLSVQGTAGIQGALSTNSNFTAGLGASLPFTYNASTGQVLIKGALKIEGLTEITSTTYTPAWSGITGKPSPVVTVALTGDVTGTASVTLAELAAGTYTASITTAAKTNLGLTTPLIGGGGANFSGSTSGQLNLKATAAAGSGVVITLPATTGTVITTGDSGTVTNAMLAGSIANNKLTNNSVTVSAGTGLSGGGALSLGGSVTLTNAGVTSIASGSGISINAFTGAVTVSHSSTSTLSGAQGGNGISSITVDAFGHVTAVGTSALPYATETYVTTRGYITAAQVPAQTFSSITTALGYTPYNSTNPNGYISSAALAGYATETYVTTRGYATETYVTTRGYITGITSGNVTSALGYTPYNSTNPNGYISGITSGNVTTALGFTPYNNTNPSGFITSAGSCAFATSAGTATNQSGGTVSATTVNTSSNIVCGGFITAVGDITAGTSDDRLKTRFGNIPDALNKVLQLNGFYYTHNKTAQQLGLVNKGQRVGVSAQEVLKVLPEVIRDAPVDESYMTVDYAKMVPLLIEAIKGLNAKVESLEAQLKK